MAKTPGIKHEALLRQATSFDGMLWERGIRPTDIDGMIDFGDSLFVFVELKYKGVGMDLGQKLAFERMRNRIAKGGAFCYVLIGNHEADGTILMAQCRLVSYYNGQWHEPRKPITIFDTIERLRKRHGVVREKDPAKDDQDIPGWDDLPKRLVR